MKNTYLKKHEDELNSNSILKSYHQELLNYFGLNDEFIVTNVCSRHLNFKSKHNYYFNIEILHPSHWFNQFDKHVKINRTIKFYSDDLNSITANYDSFIDQLKKFPFSNSKEYIQDEFKEMKFVECYKSEAIISDIKNRDDEQYPFFFESKEDELKYYRAEYSVKDSCLQYKTKNIYGFLIQKCFLDLYNIKIHPDDNEFIQEHFKNSFKLKEDKFISGDTHYTHHLVLESIESIIKSIVLDENNRISNESKEIILINFKV